MSIMVNIEQAILRLDAAAFQKLCNAYLVAKGYFNLVALGGKPGTLKTTKGTPDAYFENGKGKYIFVEYTTTQNNLFAKVKTDIEDCLDFEKTKVPHDKVSEIVYCHTSSNLIPSQDMELKKMCQSVGIQLRIIGIDQLASDLYLDHEIIVRDYLGISITTGQVQTVEEFIHDYNSNKIAAPLDTKFLFRSKELEKIDDAFKETDIVILSGAAGAGKTRLALQYAKQQKDIDRHYIYCIRSKTLPIYEDLKRIINNPGDYFILVDDANLLSGLEHVIRYTNKRDDGYNVKILITVRDYALNIVIRDIQEIASHHKIDINVFSADEIRKILKKTLGINNSNYQDRIIEIAEGNARIAMLAGRIALDSNRLDSINDLSQLYDDYYSRYLEENELLNDSQLSLVAGVLAFLETVHLGHLDFLNPVLEKMGLEQTGFVENVRRLHDNEIVDIYHDKAVRFSDQSFSNYLLKYIFYDKKILDLSEVIKIFFQDYKTRTITSINTLLNIFRNQELQDFVESEIKLVWTELFEEDSQSFDEFLKVFFRVNPIESLLILKHKIDAEDTIVIDIDEIDVKNGEINQTVSNDTIEMLGGFYDMSDLPTALDLFISYYLKRPDLYPQFYHAVNTHYGINQNSIRNDFYTQISLFEKIKQHSCDWTQKFINILFLEVSQEFLKLNFSGVSSLKDNQMTHYNFPLLLTEGVQVYRKLIWESVLEISKNNEYNTSVRGILKSYGGAIEDTSIPVLKFDLPYIKKIMNLYFPPNELQNSLLAEGLDLTFSSIDTSFENQFSKYFQSDSYYRYKLLKGPDWTKEIGYEGSQKLRRTQINSFLATEKLEGFKELVNIFREIKHDDGNLTWQVREGFIDAFEALSLKKEVYISAIKYYIEQDTPFDIHPGFLMKNLFSLYSDVQIYELITCYEYKQRNTWIYAYYLELPQDMITSKHLEGLHDYLSADSDRTLNSASVRDVKFLEKFNVIDKDAFLKGCRIILNKKEYSLFIVNLYFKTLFNSYSNKPYEIIRKFEEELELLEEIYYVVALNNQHLDHDGNFLKEFYLVRPSILDWYIASLIDQESGFYSSRMGSERNRCFFDLDNYIVIYNNIFEQLVKKVKFPEMSVPSYLETIILPVANKDALLDKQDEWIKQCIKLNYDNQIKMSCLFSAISKLEARRKKEYILLFLDLNQSIDSFKKIPITPRSYTWSGSLIPKYSSWIDFLQSMLPELVGVEWIEHKSYIEKKIIGYQQMIKSYEIDEILRR